MSHSGSFAALGRPSCRAMKSVLVTKRPSSDRANCPGSAPKERAGRWFRCLPPSLKPGMNRVRLPVLRGKKPDKRSITGLRSKQRSLPKAGYSRKASSQVHDWRRCASRRRRRRRVRWSPPPRRPIHHSMRRGASSRNRGASRSRSRSRLRRCYFCADPCRAGVGSRVPRRKAKARAGRKSVGRRAGGCCLFSSPVSFLRALRVLCGEFLFGETD